MAAAVSLALAACATTPQSNVMLEQARAQVTSAQANPHVEGESKVDLTAAQDALARGDALLKAGKPVADVNHEAYVAERFALAAQKGAELETSKRPSQTPIIAATLCCSWRERMMLHALTSSRRPSPGSSTWRSRICKASKTDRGVVITLGDVLFATGSADLKSGSRQTLDKLTAFLQAYPKRAVQIDGYTDNVGSDDYNQQLSERRADSVRDALTRMGIAQGSDPDEGAR